MITPKGILRLNIFCTEKIELKQFKSKIKKIIIKKNMGWCDDPISKIITNLLKLPSKYNYEKLYKKENVYDIILVLNYNMNPVLKIKVVQFLFM